MFFHFVLLIEKALIGTRYDIYVAGGEPLEDPITLIQRSVFFC